MEINNGFKHAAAAEESSQPANVSGVNENRRRAPEIGVPPAALWKRVLLEREGGATWPEIEEMSPDFPEWERAGEEVLQIFPGRRLPSATLEDWDLRRSLQMCREAERENRWTQEAAARAAHSARMSGLDLEMVVEGALQQLAFNLLRLAQAKGSNERSQERALAGIAKLARWIDQKHRREMADHRKKLAEQDKEFRRQVPPPQREIQEPPQPQSPQSPQSKEKPKAAERNEPSLGEQSAMEPRVPPPAPIELPRLEQSVTPEHRPLTEGKTAQAVNETKAAQEKIPAEAVSEGKPVKAPDQPITPPITSKNAAGPAPNAKSTPNPPGTKERRMREERLRKKLERKAAKRAARMKRRQGGLGKDQSAKTP